MKTILNKTILVLAIVGLVGFFANPLYAQQVKKKVIRVIEDDGKGEKVVKEYDITNNRQKFDRISRDVRKKMEIERIKMDSLRKIMERNMPRNIEFPQIPDVPEPPFFDLGFDDHTGNFFEGDCDFDFDFVLPDFEPQGPKVFYSEKSLDKSGDLDKMLQDLENGTFDPAKYNMKEVEKDKLKDFKTNGKGNVIILGDNPVVVHPRINRSSRDFNRQIRKIRHSDRGNMFYLNCDSLGDKTKTFSIVSTDDEDPNCEKVVIIKSNGKDRKFKYNYNENDNLGNDKRMVVIANDNGMTKFLFTKPSAEELKKFEKSDLGKVDESKLLPTESLIMIPQEDKDKYKIKFEAEESGKVKVILTDENGKLISSESFDYSKGKFEKEIEIKDLKSGVYYLQAQLNKKTTTSKLKVTKE